jgi:hypothetical protein
MSTRKECDNKTIDHRILSDDVILDLGFDLMERVVDMSESWVHI